MRPQAYEQLKQAAKAQLATAPDRQALAAAERALLGRDGLITRALRRLGEIGSSEARRSAGATLNSLKVEVRAALAERAAQLADAGGAFQVRPAPLDVTAPGPRPPVGHRHPVTVVAEDLMAIFKDLGFLAVDGPELETDFYNFTALNIPPRHAARDLWSTFWLANGKDLLLRTHTSPMQVRYLQQHTPPLRIVVPGKCFRYEATDRTHEAQFWQLEGLMVDHAVTIANFRAIIGAALSRLFGAKQVAVRLRPSYFPFVEPGFEVDMGCVFCGQKGCDVCKQSGWIEMAGAGMVHPNVFAAIKFAPGEWQGFAFGLGLERVAMLKYNIRDIRVFSAGDVHLSRQF